MGIAQVVLERVDLSIYVVLKIYTSEYAVLSSVIEFSAIIAFR